MQPSRVPQTPPLSPAIAPGTRALVRTFVNIRRSSVTFASLETQHPRRRPPGRLQPRFPANTLGVALTGGR